MSNNRKPESKHPSLQQLKKKTDGGMSHGKGISESYIPSCLLRRPLPMFSLIRGKEQRQNHPVTLSIIHHHRTLGNFSPHFLLLLTPLSHFPPLSPCLSFFATTPLSPDSYSYILSLLLPLLSPLTFLCTYTPSNLLFFPPL